MDFRRKELVAGFRGGVVLILISVGELLHRHATLGSKHVDKYR